MSEPVRAEEPARPEAPTKGRSNRPWRMTPEQMTAHVIEVAARHGITVHWIKGYRARAVAEDLEIFIPKIRSAITYAAALHELGHCLRRYQASRSVLVTERGAWRWAQRHARLWTPAMARSMRTSLAGYGARRHPPRLVNGPPGCQREDIYGLHRGIQDPAQLAAAREQIRTDLEAFERQQQAPPPRRPGGRRGRA